MIEEIGWSTCLHCQYIIISNDCSQSSFLWHCMNLMVDISVESAYFGYLAYLHHGKRANKTLLISPNLPGTCQTRTPKSKMVLNICQMRVNEVS